MAAAGRNGIVETARPLLAELSQATGATVNLAEFRHDHLVLVDRIVGSHRLRTVAAVGELFALITTANGNAGLARLDNGRCEERLRRALGGGASAPRRPRSLKRQIAQIRDRGNALDLDEHTDGISAVGAAFVTADGTIYAASIPAPSNRFARHRKDLIARLIETVDKINRRIA